MQFEKKTFILGALNFCAASPRLLRNWIRTIKSFRDSRVLTQLMPQTPWHSHLRLFALQFKLDPIPHFRGHGRPDSVVCWRRGHIGWSKYGPRPSPAVNNTKCYLSSLGYCIIHFHHFGGRCQCHLLYWLCPASPLAYYLCLLIVHCDFSVLGFL